MRIDIRLADVGVTIETAQRIALAFLDATGGDGAFVSGPGKVLAMGPYARQVEVDAEALLALARTWIVKNAGVPHES